MGIEQNYDRSENSMNFENVSFVWHTVFVFLPNLNMKGQLAAF